MKKYIQNFWGRTLARFLCTMSVMVLVLSAVVSGFYVTQGDERTALNDGNQELAENYSLYALDMALRGEVVALNEYMQKEGVDYAITKFSAGEEVGELLASNSMETIPWEYEFQVVEGSQYHYDTTSLWYALTGSYHYAPQDNWVSIQILGVVYDAEAGLFYYETEAGYFLIKNIIIRRTDDSYIDYVYKIIDGKPCYYNGYYRTALDTTKTELWKYLEVDHFSYQLWSVQTESYAVRYVTSTEELQDRIRNKTYYLEENHYITYVYEGEVGSYKIQIANTAQEDKGMFQRWSRFVHGIYAFEEYVFTIIVISSAALLIGLFLLAYTVERDVLRLRFFHKVPLGLYSIIIFIIEVVLFLALSEKFLEWLYYEVVPWKIGCLIVAMTGWGMIWMAFAYLQNVITRICTKSLIRHSEIYYAVKLMKHLLKWIAKPLIHTVTVFKAVGVSLRANTSLLFKSILLLGGISVVELFVILLNLYNRDALIGMFFFGKLIEIPVVCFVILQLQRLQEGAKNIAAGDISKPINTKYMYWELKKHGEYLNNVSDSIHLAVQEQMKSERFKTELITNVSHDIKTPLTSIINYVDLIKKENIEDERLNEYVEVLDRQSARLKKLIEDLMEASKASTGNLTVTLEEFDVEVLLTQVIGEFEDRLEKNDLEMIVDKPEHSVYVMADARHMWRVFDNILSNTCKYSLPNTRVYVSLQEEYEMAVITVKNISKAALNMPSEELLERFVRGDSSRNTEGSGLGLSIAQSLTELMKGSMKLEIDGDLFKVILRFPIIKKE